MKLCPRNAVGVSKCAQVLQDQCAGAGVDVRVTLTPAMNSPYTLHGFTCPHGMEYWLHPTPEQIAQWERDGVE